MKISNLPSIIARAKTPFPKSVTEPYVSETIPRPGPKLFKQAPIAEKALSKSIPVASKDKGLPQPRVNNRNNTWRVSQEKDRPERCRGPSALRDK